MGQAAGRQRQHRLVDPGQPPLTLLHDLRLEPSRSRGASGRTGPTSVTTVLERMPLRVLPEAVFSCFSWPG